MSEENVDPRSVWPESTGETPFHVVIRKTQPSPFLPPGEAEEFLTDPDEESFSLDEIEAAYLRALESADLAESQALPELEAPAPSPSGDDQPDLMTAQVAEQESDQLILPDSQPLVDSVPQQTVPSEADVSELVEEHGHETELPLTSAEQVVEALLFVGGAPLPVKKFLDVLGGTHSIEQVEGMLEALNSRYAAQRRPYEVRLIEGGYQLQLASTYEGVRARVYGHGPKEVKLAQDALEVLALIAYQQPISRDSLNEIGKPNLPGLLRQLLRRELICVDRSDPERGECYRSMPRFLELFGLSSLDDLPQAGTFQFR